MNFDTVALEWDTELRIERAKVLAQEICNSLPSNVIKKAMEFGCGTGLLSCFLADKFQEIVCVDTSREMLKILNKKIVKLNINHITTMQADLLSAENDLNDFNLVYSSMVLHHIKETAQIINKLYECLDKNGTLIIIDLDKEDGSFHKDEIDFNGHNGFEHEQLKAVLEKSGFSDISFKTVFKGEKILQDKTSKYSLFMCIARK